MVRDNALLYRPVGQVELELIAASGWRRFPPRLSHQPIFYPVLSEEYATKIARDWNTNDPVSGFVGYVLRFAVCTEVFERWPPQQGASGAIFRELWVPADDLDDFNAAIVGQIEVVAEYRGAGAEAGDGTTGAAYAERVNELAGRDSIVAYDFAGESERIAQMQKASLDPGDLGLAPDPLVGSEEWWAEISSGKRPTHIVEGTIESVFWGSMGDWPEFRIRTVEGEESTWTREGDISRYVEGLRVRLSYVEHGWKPGSVAFDARETGKVVLRIEVEDSQLRSSTLAPGPGR